MTTNRASILIVDNDARNRRLLEAMLIPEGYRTFHAQTGEEALSAVIQQRPDLILLDVMMPGMDGYEVASRIKGDPDTAHIPIIMVTAQVDRDARLAGLNAGAEDFLTKPVERTELWLRVRNLLRLKAYSDFLQNHRRLLEQEVQSRTADLQRFRTAMDATADAIMLVSRQTMCFVEVNATACKMFGYSVAELLQIGPEQLASAEYIDFNGSYDVLIADTIANNSATEHISSGLVEVTLKRKDGTTFPAEVHRQAQQHGSNWIIVAVVRDITERKQAEQYLHHLAHFDALTGLPNRSLFYNTLQTALIQAASNGWKIAVLFIDLDHFKNVNDTLGHPCGDELLLQFGKRLVQCVRIRDTVGRLGGDEFAVLLVMPDEQQAAVLVANKIKELLRTPFHLKGHEVYVTASVGITVFPDDANDHETLIKYADTAMYRAKLAGRDTFRFFTAQMNTDALARIELEGALRRAIEQDEFLLHYQPKVDIASGKVVGAEALLRWNRPGHGLVSPGAFIPVLEETGLIVRVGSWVISTACRQIAAWLQSGVGALQISVNVAGRQFIEGDLLGDVSNALTKFAIPPALLELELTESSLMANTENTIDSMRQLKQHGVKISIDDFGTGFSSLAYLCRFPIDKLKIDIAFIRHITTNPDDATIVRTIIQMAHGLNLQVIAEGVETEQQLAYLRRHHCDQIQGFYFSRPLPAADLQQLLLDKKCLNAAGQVTSTESVISRSDKRLP